MTPKQARPVKAKALPKQLRVTLESLHEGTCFLLSHKGARAILAALKHEYARGWAEGAKR